MISNLVMSPYLHAIAHSESNLAIGSPVGISALRVLNRTPLHVVAWNDAVEMHRQQLCMRARQIGHINLRADWEELRQSLVN